MAKREWTAQRVKEMIESGQVQPEETTHLTVSLTYGQLELFLEAREDLKLSTSQMVRDGAAELRKARKRPTNTNEDNLRHELLNEQAKIKEEILSTVQKLKVPNAPAPEQEQDIKARIHMFLEDIGPLATKELAKYVGQDWRVIDKYCVEMQGDKVIGRTGSKWALAEGEDIE